MIIICLIGLILVYVGGGIGIEFWFQKHCPKFVLTARIMTLQEVRDAMSDGYKTTRDEWALAEKWEQIRLWWWLGGLLAIESIATIAVFAINILR